MNKADRPSIYLDSNILIHLVEGLADHASEIDRLLALFETDEARFSASELCLAEVLVVPLRLKLSHIVARFEELLNPASGIEMLRVDASVLRNSAEHRARFGGGMLDAIHVVSAQSAGCHFFLSQDARIKVVAPMQKLTLTDFARQFGP
jgi:predicted nucleic acid-binding protein